MNATGGFMVPSLPVPIPGKPWTYRTLAEYSAIMKGTIMNEPVIGKAFVTYEKSPACGCSTGPNTSHPLRRTMIACEICGNNRCPHAVDKSMLCVGNNDIEQSPITATIGTNSAIAVLEHELAVQMAKVESIKAALATVRSMAAEQAKEGRMV